MAMNPLDLLLTGGGMLVNAVESERARQANIALQKQLEGIATGRMDFLAQNLIPQQQNLLDRLGTRQRDLIGRQARDTANLRGLLGKEQAGLTSAYDKGTGALIGAANKRQRDVMGLLEGLGEQEKSDIRRDFEGLRGETQRGLTRRGLAGSSMMPSLFSGIQRRQSEALGAADERIRGQRAGFLSNLSGDVLNLQGARTAGREALTGGFAGQRLGFEESRRNDALGLTDRLSAEGINARQGMINQNAGLFTQLSGDLLNTVASQNIGYPDQGAFLSGLQQLGYARGVDDYVNSLNQGFFSGGGAILGGASGAITGAALSPFLGPFAGIPAIVGGGVLGAGAGGASGYIR